MWMTADERRTYQTVFTPGIQTDCTSIQPQGAKLVFFWFPSIYLDVHFCQRTPAEGGGVRTESGLCFEDRPPRVGYCQLQHRVQMTAAADRFMVSVGVIMYLSCCQQISWKSETQQHVIPPLRTVPTLSLNPKHILPHWQNASLKTAHKCIISFFLKTK